MNSLFTLPIHGLSCLPFCKAAADSYVHTLKLEEKTRAKNKALPLILEKKCSNERDATHFQSFHNIFHNKILKPASYQLKIDCQGSGLIDITQNKIMVDWQEQGTDFNPYSQTFTAAVWLELNNTLCIHANTWCIDEQTIMLVAPSQAGKSMLSLALCQQGFSLMTDDMAALHNIASDYYIYPSWPVARIWPDSFKFINESPNTYQKVHENFNKRTISSSHNHIEFSNQAQKLQNIYFLNRVKNLTDVCNLIEISKSKAIIQLLQNSILGDAYRALNIEETRLQVLAKLVENISFKQVNYQSGLNVIALVAEHIKKTSINNNFSNKGITW